MRVSGVRIGPRIEFQNPPLFLALTHTMTSNNKRILRQTETSWYADEDGTWHGYCCIVFRLGQDFVWQVHGGWRSICTGACRWWLNLLRAIWRFDVDWNWVWDRLWLSHYPFTWWGRRDEWSSKRWRSNLRRGCLLTKLGYRERVQILRLLLLPCHNKKNPFRLTFQKHSSLLPHQVNG